MSAKDDFSNSKVKDFFILHGEKVAFGVCLLLVVVFFLLGRGVESLEPNKTPSTLSSRVVAANQHMSRLDERTWKEQIEEAREPNFDLEEFVIEGRKTIDYTEYISFLWRPAREPQALRKDPDLLPPSKPRLVAVNAAMAVPGRESALDLLEIAEVEEEEEKPARGGNDRDDDDDIYGGRVYGGGPGTGFDPYSADDAGADDQPTAMTDTDEPKYRELTPRNRDRLPGFKLAGTSGVPQADGCRNRDRASQRTVAGVQAEA